MKDDSRRLLFGAVLLLLAREILEVQQRASACSRPMISLMKRTVEKLTRDATAHGGRRR